MTDSPEQAWIDGHAAGHEGRPRTVNPHWIETDLARDWLDGWREGDRLRLGMHLAAPDGDDAEDEPEDDLNVVRT